jgi:hypothetical protein
MFAEPSSKSRDVQGHSARIVASKWLEFAKKGFKYFGIGAKFG